MLNRLRFVSTLFVSVLGLASTIQHELSAQPTTTPPTAYFVFGDDGEPLRRFDVNLVRDHTWTGMQTQYDGRIRSNDLVGKLSHNGNIGLGELFIRADGYAPVFVPFDPRDAEKVRRIHMDRGQVVKLRIYDSAGIPPDVLLEPVVCLSRHRALIKSAEQLRARGSQYDYPRFYPIDTISDTDDGFTFRVQSDVEEFYVYIHSPGFLRQHFAGPFTAADTSDGLIEVALPKPAQVDVSFRPQEDDATSGPLSNTSILLSRYLDGSGDSLEMIDQVSNEGSDRTVHSWSDLPPGKYAVYVYATYGDAPSTSGQVYRDREVVELGAGDYRDVTFVQTRFDKNGHQGDHSIVVSLEGGRFSENAGPPYELFYSDPHYQEVSIARGQLQADRSLRFEGLSAHRRGSEDIASATFPSGPPQYLLQIDEGRLGRFWIRIDGPEKEHEFSFILAPDVGELAPDIETTHVFTDEPIRLSDFSGQVVFLEFWATWCGPCQQPMEKNARIMGERSAEWRNRATILAVSIDNELPTVREHVTKRGWEAVLHAWDGSGAGGWQSNAAITYGINSVPTALLIDQEGRIRWRGHPNEMSIETKIEELLAEKVD